MSSRPFGRLTAETQDWWRVPHQQKEAENCGNRALQGLAQPELALPQPSQLGHCPSHEGRGSGIDPPRKQSSLAAGSTSQRLRVRPFARRKAERHHSSSALTTRGRTRLPKGSPALGLRPLTTKIHMTTTLQALGIKTPHQQPNSTTGVASQRLQGGPLARRRKAERHHSFHLDRKRAHAASKGGGVPGSTPSTRTTHTATTTTTLQASGVKRRGRA
jgi:hypothetical protein